MISKKNRLPGKKKLGWPHIKFLPLILLWSFAVVFTVLSRLVGAQLTIPTVINNAVIVISEVLFSDTWIDDATVNKVRVYSDSGFAETLTVVGDLKVTNLVTPGAATTYLVTTDTDGILSFIDAASIWWWAGAGWGKWIDSIAQSTGLYYDQHVAVGADVDANYALKVFDELNALRISNGNVRIDELWDWVTSNWPWVMTVDSSGVVSMTKVSSSMLTSTLQTQIAWYWQSAWGGNIYYNSGWVGIWTINPTLTLEVDGDALVDRLYVLNGESTFTNNGTDAYRYTTPWNDIRLWSANNNVSIGWGNPAAKLDVDGDVLIDAWITDASWLTFDDLNYNSVTAADINDVDCNVLWVDANWEVILVNADTACAGGSGWWDPKSYQVTKINTITNTNSTPVLIDGMQVTPPWGTYYVSFNASAFMDRRDRSFSYQIYIGWVPVAHTYRLFTQSRDSDNQRNVISTQWIVTTDGQTIEVRRAELANNEATIIERSLNLIKVTP